MIYQTAAKGWGTGAEEVVEELGEFWFWRSGVGMLVVLGVAELRLDGTRGTPKGNLTKGDSGR